MTAALRVTTIDHTQVTLRNSPSDLTAMEIATIVVTQVSSPRGTASEITVSPTPPTNPYLNQLWLDTSTSG